MKHFLIALLLLLFLASPLSAQTPIDRYDTAYSSVNGGDGYKTYHNETATLAWGEGYIMMSFVAAYEGTGDLAYLDLLADHADHVLANRDDNRGVVDYRAISGACWRNLHYQPNDEPYCYAVHSGMITYPMAAFARIVRDDPTLWTQTTYDGSTYLAKAEKFVTACYETIAFHEDQWADDGDAGYYQFRYDATFLPYPGRDLPLNQGNALGRTIASLAVSENDAILAALRKLPSFPTILGPGHMSGKEMFGIENMIEQPVPMNMFDLKAGDKRIIAHLNFEPWYASIKKVVLEAVKERGQHWSQRK